MIATRRFLFIHLHKSGGTFVNRWLLRFFPEAKQIGYHLPRRLVPVEFAHLPAVGLVRNPWSYYVSWFAFQSSMPRPNALFQVLSDEGRLGFEGTIRAMLDLGSGGEQLDTLVAALPNAYTSHGLNLPGPELEAIRNTGLGFYSFLYSYMYDGDGRLEVATMEGMRDEFPKLVATLGEPVSEAAASDFANAPARNSSAHRPYPEYYDADLRDLVGERDRGVIERFGYRFGE